MLEIESRLVRILAGTERPREKLRLLITGIYQMASFLDSPALDDLHKHYPGLWQKIDTFRSARILFLEGLITEGMACGDFRPLSPAVAAAALLGLAKAIVNPAFILNHSLSGAEAFPTVFDLFLYGVAAADGGNQEPSGPT